MSIKQQTQPSAFGMAMQTITNGLGMINNTFIAGERITYIAASKASNLAEISGVADTLKLVVAKKELADKCQELGVQVDANGNMTF